MDTSAQNQIQTFPVQPQSSLPVQPAQYNPAQHVSVQQPPRESIADPLSMDSTPSLPPSMPVSLPHREAGPGLGKMSEFIKPTEVSPVIPNELKEAGVEVSPNTEQPSIPAAVVQLGVQPAKAAVPVAALTGESVHYLTDAPFTQVEAVKIEKSANAKNSIRWLATFLIKQFKKIQLLGT